MMLDTDPKNRWHNAKVYKFRDYEIAVVKATKYEPVRWYTEVHKWGIYHSSFGSRAPFKLWAVYIALWRASNG